MQKPRNSLLELFDPLTINSNSPQTPSREAANASPDNSDKENELPKSSFLSDPFSFTQFFNRTYKLNRQQLANPVKQQTPSGKLIDFGDVTAGDEDDQLVSISLENQEIIGDSDHSSPEDDEEENMFSKENLQVFKTPQNRKVLSDIDVDVPQPPKLPVKQGTLKISFVRSVMDSKGTQPLPSPNLEVAPSVSEENDASNTNVAVPVITLYPPAFDSECPHERPELQPTSTNSSRHFPPQTPSYFKDSPVASATPRYSTLSPSSNSFDARRASIDLQASFQRQLQSAEFSFDLVNDRISFFGGQGSLLCGLEEESDLDKNEEKKVGDIIKKAEAVLASKTLSRRVQSSLVPSSPASEISCADSLEDGTSLCIEGLVDEMVEKPIPALSIVKKNHTIRESTSSATSRSSSTSSSSSQASKSNGVLKLPMRVPVTTDSFRTMPSARTSARPSIQVVASTTGLCRRQSSTVNTLGATKRSVDAPTEGPRRVLVQSRPASERLLAAKHPVASIGRKGVGPQRILVRPSPSSTVPDPAAKNASESRLPCASSSTTRIPGLAARASSKVAPKPIAFGKRI